MAFFKTKAVGEVEEFENKLRDVIGEKFKQFKNRFFKLQRVRSELRLGNNRGEDRSRS